MIVLPVMLMATVLPGAPCNTKSVAVDALPADAGMSKVQLTFKITNKGTTDCTLQGTPTVALLDNRGKTVPLAKPFSQGFSAEAEPVVLKTGAAGYFAIRYGTSGPYNPGECPPASAAIRIVLPHDTKPIVITAATDACTKLAVSPLESSAPN